MPADTLKKIRVLVTGGTGSLGRALIRRLLSAGAERICSLARKELDNAKLQAAYADTDQVRVFTGDVRDLDRLTDAMWGLDTVIHAAALKRVDGGSYEPEEMLLTNVWGTRNVLRAAQDAGIRRVVFISSDKAVQPLNIYGAAKMAAEHLVVNRNSFSVPHGLACSVVRYGNVLGSNGSVIHLWRQQVAEDKPITVTDPRITRFWLTLDQACDLVFHCLQVMRGGEILLPILPSMRILDLAEALAPGYRREITGLRPGGEKLHESLMSSEEVKRSVRRDGHIVIQPTHHSWTSEAWEGDPLPEDFVYRSDANDKWVSVEQMREWIKSV